MKIYITTNGFVATNLKKAFRENLTDNIKKADIVINTAGILKEEKYSFEESHIEFVKNLIPFCKDKKLIHISALGVSKNHPAKYKHTKAQAEEIIKKNIKNYAILKPSIIMGKGQKIFEDLKKFKNMPVILAPKMKIQPIHIDDLIKFTKMVIKKDLKGEFNLCGENIISMKELFSFAFSTFGKKPIIIQAPKQFFKLILPVLEKLSIMTKEEYLMIEDNICIQNDTKKYLGELKNAKQI